MLRGAIICPNQDLISSLDQALVHVGRIQVVRVLDHYPSLVELSRVLRAAAPQVLFISTEEMDQATSIVRNVETLTPGVQMIAISRHSDPEMLLEAMRVGIREFLSVPFDFDKLSDAFVRVEEFIQKRPPSFGSSDLVFSFLPSKAGVGTSTIAMNVAVAMSRLPDTRVILSDFDLNSGMLRFLLKLSTAYSVADAIEHAADMDEELWPQLVTSIGNLDVLHAGQLNPNLRIEPAQIRRLIDFQRRHYRALCFDLSGNLERYSFEIMHESKRIFLVCTPEIPSLHLAREKYSFLKTLDLGDRVSVLVNRVSKRPVITAEQIEQILGLPVTMTFPNDYNGVARSVTAGKSAGPKSELGIGFARLAQDLVENKVSALKPEQRKRFIEYFALPPRPVQPTRSTP